MSDLLSILQHSLGVDQHGQGNMYRDHFVAGPGHSDFATCQDAVRLGLMIGQKNSQVVGGHIFFVTEAGKVFVRENSPPPPKLTASQKRYRRFLDHDSGENFGQWLKTYGRNAA